MIEPPTPAVVVSKHNNSDQIGMNIFHSVNDLDPQEGLMVAFSTVAETIKMYWPVALALGLLTALLLWIGLSKLELEPLEDQVNTPSLA